MINIEVHIRRDNYFWKDMKPSNIESYREELQKTRKTLMGFRWEHRRMLFGSEDTMKDVVNAIDEEIKLCDFYVNYVHRRDTEANFNEWIFQKQEDIEYVREWDKPKGERWTRTNGRVKATIQFDRSGKTVKISLSYQDDNSKLVFLSPYDGRKPITSHLKNVDSIRRKVRFLKVEADTFLEDHLFPIGEPTKNSFEVLKKLLCIGGE